MVLRALSATQNSIKYNTCIHVLSRYLINIYIFFNKRPSFIHSIFKYILYQGLEMLRSTQKTESRHISNLNLYNSHDRDMNKVPGGSEKPPWWG